MWNAERRIDPCRCRGLSLKIVEESSTKNKRIPRHPKGRENATRSATRKSAIDDAMMTAAVIALVATKATTMILYLENEKDTVEKGIQEYMERKSAGVETVIPVVTMYPTILPPLMIVGAKSTKGGNHLGRNVAVENVSKATAKGRDEKMKRDGSKWAEGATWIPKLQKANKITSIPKIQFYFIIDS